MSAQYDLPAMLFLDGMEFSAQYVLGEKSPVLREKYYGMMAAFQRNFLLVYLAPATFAYALQTSITYGAHGR